ncbi:MAG: 30S ribosomal protein S20 [Deltaproteobacteria bacterium]
MANHKSAVKRHRQSENRRQRNASTKSNLKTAIKRAAETAASGKAAEAQAGLKKAISLLDKAVTKKVLHRNNASRKISRLAKAAGAVQPK